MRKWIVALVVGLTAIVVAGAFFVWKVYEAVVSFPH